MSKTLIGILFIISGLCYGSLSVDLVYQKTLGWLVENKWIIPPTTKSVNSQTLGRKETIIVYSLALIFIGIFILWNRNR